MFVIFVLCLVSIVVAQPPPRPCTTPPQWEANIFDTNEQQQLTVAGAFSYDATNHRERILETVIIGRTNDSYDVIALYDSKVEYIYDFNAKNCTRRPLTRPWRDFGIRPDAQFLGEAYIGTSAAPGMGLFVTRWGGNYTTPTNDTGRDFGAWTVEHCLPVDFVRYSQTYGRTQTIFINIMPNISNPNVFIPRKECLTAEEYSLRDVIFGKSSKMAHLST